jgi:GST-like protein
MAEAGRYTLLASKGFSLAVVEVCLDAAGLPYALEELDHGRPGPDRDRLLSLNPLCQVPTLILPDGSVMTESAAMALHIAETAPGAGLAPPPGGDRPAPRLLRWLDFLVGSIDPNFTYGDEPSRYVGGGAATAELRASTDAFAQRCWRLAEEGAVPGGPWFLGGRFSVLDPYVSVMTRWRPLREWFAEHCPRLHAVATGVDADPRVARVWARNYG